LSYLAHVWRPKQAGKILAEVVHQQQRFRRVEASGDPELHHFRVIANSFAALGKKASQNPEFEKKRPSGTWVFTGGQAELQPLYAKGKPDRGVKGRNIERLFYWRRRETGLIALARAEKDPELKKKARGKTFAYGIRKEAK